MLDDPDEARRLVSQRDRTPIAMVIPAGTSAAVAAGRQPRLILFVDPVRRVEVNALELRIDELCRRVTEQAQATAQKQIEASGKDLREKIKRLSVEIASEQSDVRSQFARTQAALEISIRTQIAAALKQVSDATETTIETRERQAWADVQRQLSQRQAILLEIQNYLTQLQSSQRAFEDWLAKLKTMAGSHASDIPPPPSFPKPISETELAELAKPVTAAQARSNPSPNGFDGCIFDQDSEGTRVARRQSDWRPRAPSRRRRRPRSPEISDSSSNPPSRAKRWL